MMGGTEEGSRYFITAQNHSDDCHYMYCLLATNFSNVRSVGKSSK